MLSTKPIKKSCGWANLYAMKYNSTYMSVTGKCPKCGCKKAQFLSIDRNHNVMIDCPPNQGCNLQAAVSLKKALRNIDSSKYPLKLD